MYNFICAPVVPVGWILLDLAESKKQMKNEGDGGESSRITRGTGGDGNDGNGPEGGRDDAASNGRTREEIGTNWFDYLFLI